MMQVIRILCAIVMLWSAATQAKSNSFHRFPDFKIGDSITCSFENLNSYAFKLTSESFETKNKVMCFTIDVYVLNEHGLKKIDQGKHGTGFCEPKHSHFWMFTFTDGNDSTAIRIYSDGRAEFWQYDIKEIGTWVYNPKDVDEGSGDPQ